MTVAAPILTREMQATLQKTGLLISPRVAPACTVEITQVIDEVNFAFSYYKTNAKSSRAVSGLNDRANLGSEATTVPGRLDDATAFATMRSLQDIIGLDAHNTRTPRARQSHEAMKARQVTDRLGLLREIRTVDFFKSSTFSLGETGTTNRYWDDPSFDPMRAIIPGVSSISNAGNGQARVFAMGYNVAIALSRNPNIRTLNGDRPISVANLAELLRDSLFQQSAELRATGATDFEIIIGGASQDTGGFFGDTVTASNVWSNFAVLLDVPTTGEADIEIESAAYNAAPVAPGAAANANAPTISMIDDEKTGRRLVVGKLLDGLFSPNPAKAYFFKTPVETPLAD